MSSKSENSKLITLYNSLDKTEKVQLWKFIQSPFHNKHDKILQLFEIIRNKKLSKDPIPSNEALYRALYPEKPYDDLKMRHLKSILFQKMEHFLAYSRIMSHGPMLQLQVLEAYKAKGMDKHFSSALRSAEKLVSKASLKSLDSHFYNFQNELVSFDTQTENSQKVKEQIQNISDDLDIYYFSIKLRTACSLLSYQKVFMSVTQLPMTSEVIDQIERRNLKLVPAIGIYYHIYYAHTSGEVEMHYPMIKRYLKEWEKEFNIRELRTLYEFAINICRGQVNTGNRIYLREILSLYQSALKANVLIENDILPAKTYINIVKTGLQLKELEWTEQFIHDYRSHLPAEFRDSLYKNNLAKLYFTQREFNKAIDTLSSTQSTDIVIDLDSQVVRVKSFFEMKNLKLAENQLHNIDKYLKNRKAPGYQKKNFSNFINFTQRTMELGTGDELRRARLIADINSAEVLTEKEWLLDKLF